MEPLLPTGARDLDDLAREVVARSAALGGQLHPITQGTVTELLRWINSYYSNLIEGHSTHPVDIERAMREDYARDPAKRDLQVESLAHIHCQRELEARLDAEPGINTADCDFLLWLHRTFYARLPDRLREVRDEDTGEVATVAPGALRQREVRVGRHVGPRAERLGAFLERFASFYRTGAFHGITPLVAAAAAHHRLMWIHPFLDGNGRVARLYTDACFRHLPLRGYGLWNVSRGLARRRSDYMAALTWADAPRRNDHDGRGNLSDEGLARFCRFFLEVCLDQCVFMGGMLRLDTLLDRVEGYVQGRALKVLPGPTPDAAPLKREASYMLQEVLLRGEMARGDVLRVSGMAERTGRDLLAQLLQEGLLVSDSPKGRVRLGIPTHVAGALLPDLYPAQVLA
ncbi:MAG: Fic family protein [Deltaproteobacteria bacterium]|nr:Fic family protein [Deltaproteobacteria bacterium]